jgi:hypothetical protein
MTVSAIPPDGSRYFNKKGIPPMPQPNPHIAGLFDEEQTQAIWAGRWRWKQLNGEPVREQADVVGDEMYRRGYRLGDMYGYTETAYRIAAAATQAAVGSRTSRPSLDPLIAAAVKAADSGRRTRRPAPPAGQGTLDAAAEAARTNKDEPWRPLAETAWRRGLCEGINAGVVLAAEHILGDWRSHAGVNRARTTTINGLSAADWVGNMLAQVHDNVITPWIDTPPPAQTQHGQLVPSVLPGRDTVIPSSCRTAPKLACQDQATAAVTTPITVPDAGRHNQHVQPAVPERTQ